MYCMLISVLLGSYTDNSISIVCNWSKKRQESDKTNLNKSYKWKTLRIQKKSQLVLKFNTSGKVTISWDKEFQLLIIICEKVNCRNAVLLNFL